MVTSIPADPAHRVDGEPRAERALEILENGLEDAITVLALPLRYRRRLKSTNGLERLV